MTGQGLNRRFEVLQACSCCWPFLWNCLDFGFHLHLSTFLSLSLLVFVFHVRFSASLSSNHWSIFIKSIPTPRLLLFKSFSRKCTSPMPFGIFLTKSFPPSNMRMMVSSSLRWMPLTSLALAINCAFRSVAVCCLDASDADSYSFLLLLF